MKSILCLPTWFLLLLGTSLVSLVKKHWLVVRWHLLGCLKVLVFPVDPYSCAKNMSLQNCNCVQRPCLAKCLKPNHFRISSNLPGPLIVRPFPLFCPRTLWRPPPAPDWGRLCWWTKPFYFCGWRTVTVDWLLDPSHDLSNPIRQASLANRWGNLRGGSLGLFRQEQGSGDTQDLWGRPSPRTSAGATLRKYACDAARGCN